MLEIKFSRSWCMPSEDTFSIKPIGEFVERYIEKSFALVDPFARNHVYWKTHYTNDINPQTEAQSHKDAIVFLNELKQFNYNIDLVILDPPYSPRQISECYKALGIKVKQKDTQTGTFMKELRNAADALLKKDGVVLSFGYNTVGMGIKRGYKIEEIRLNCCGGAHNDIICLAERKL